MMTFRTLVALMLAAALLLSASRSHSSPLASCSNVGFSLGNYTITGTTHKITSADSIADVNALSVSPGDAVLFQAGNTWNIGSEGGRLQPKTGVLYGRYGAGANPVISGAGVSFGTNLRGIIDIVGEDDVTIDGINVRLSNTSLGIYVGKSDNITIRRLKVSDLPGGGIVFGSGSTNVLVEYVEISNVDGNPGESLTFTGADGYVARYNYIHDNGHAGINNKGNARNGELYGNELQRTSNDPLFYIERASNLDIHDNWVHDTTGSIKPLFSIGIENFGAQNLQYNRNIEIYNNVIESTAGLGLKLWIKREVISTVTPKFDNVHIHHNAIVNTLTDGIRAVDLRVTPVPSEWSNIVVEDNVIWNTGGGGGSELLNGTAPRFTVRYNLFQTGETGGSDLGTNTMFTNSEPFVDLAGEDYTPAGAARGAGSDGSDVGANIDWSCGTNTPNSPVQPLPPMLE